MGDVNIQRAVGQLKRTTPTEDAVIVMCLSGAAVAGKIALGDVKQIFSTDALTDLGITEGNNPLAWREIKDFYAIAGEGAEFTFMLFSNATTLTNVCDVQNNLAKKAMDYTQGRGVILMVNIIRAVGYVPAFAGGLDTDINGAVTKLQAMAVAYQADNIPFVAVLPAYGFTTAGIADLPNRSTLSNDYVALNTWCNANDGIVSMGQLAGWLAAHQVHQNAGRVKSGKVSDTAFMPDGTPAADLKYQWDTLASKGLLIPIKRKGKSGFFFKDDPCMTSVASDYSSISWNRVINKAQRIAADVLTEKINDDVDTDPVTGKLESGMVSDWEGDVENAIKAQMLYVPSTKFAEITAVKVTIDPDSDVANDKVDARIDIVRKGQAKQFNVRIGYVTTI